MREIKTIKLQNKLDEMPIRTLDKGCKYYGYRVELWKFHHKRFLNSDYKLRNKIILHKE